MIKVTRALRIGSRINQGTSGSVLFVDANGKIAQDNSNLFWDDTNNRLGVGTNTPGNILDLRQATLPIHLFSQTNPITSATDEEYARIEFRSEDRAPLTGIKTGAYISVKTDGWQSSGTTRQGSKLEFHVQNAFSGDNLLNAPLALQRTSLGDTVGLAVIDTQRPTIEFIRDSDVTILRNVHNINEVLNGSNRGDFVLKVPATKKILFGTDDSSATTFYMEDGKIGIGETSPLAKLHIDTGATTTIGQIIKAVAAQTADLSQWRNSAGTVLLEVQADGELGLIQDSKKIYWGAGRDFSAYYDGVDAYLKSNEVSASDLKVTCGANKTIELQNVVYEDLSLPLDSARVPAANAPSWETFVGNLNAYAYEVDDYQEFTTELLHGYKTGSTFEFHVHGALNAALAAGDETVKFEIEYSIADMDATDGLGDVFPATTTINAEFTVPNGTADLTNIFISIGTDATGSFDIGATIKGRIRRIASSGTELVGDIFVTQVGVHYERNTMGSRQQTAK